MFCDLKSAKVAKRLGAEPQTPELKALPLYLLAGVGVSLAGITSPPSLPNPGSAPALQEAADSFLRTDGAKRGGLHKLIKRYQATGCSYSMRQIKVGATHYGVNVLRSDRKKLRSERNYLVKYYVPLRSENIPLWP